MQRRVVFFEIVATSRNEHFYVNLRVFIHDIDELYQFLCWVQKLR